MTIRALHHVQLAMPAGGELEAERFYADVLGLARIPKPEHLAVRGGCWFRSGQVELHLGVEDDFRPARKAHPALATDDLDGIRTALERAGCEVVEAEPLEGCERFYVSDPFGNRLELLERRPS